MSCARSLAPLKLTVSTLTTTVQYAFGDAWYPVEDAAEVGATINIREVVGNIEIAACKQLAAIRTDEPDAPAVFSGASYTSTEDFTHFRETSAGGSAKLYVRVGAAHKLSTGSALGTAQVVVQPTLKSCIRLLPTRQVIVNPGQVTATDNNYMAISELLPAAGLSKVKAAFMVSDNLSSYLEYALIMRTTNDPDDPNSWQAVEGAYTNPASSYTARNTGEQSAPAGCSITDNLFFQLGVGFRMKSGAAGNPRGVISVTPAIIYS